MTTQRLLNPKSWAEQTFGDVHLQDLRRSRRAVQVSSKLAENLLESLPAQQIVLRPTAVSTDPLVWRQPHDGCRATVLRFRLSGIDGRDDAYPLLYRRCGIEAQVLAVTRTDHLHRLRETVSDAHGKCHGG